MKAFTLKLIQKVTTYFFIVFCFSMLVLSCRPQPKLNQEIVEVKSNDSTTINTSSRQLSKKFDANLVSGMNQTILCMLQDKSGIYWFGTNEGLYRFDGKLLYCFTNKDGLPQNQVIEIQDDYLGNIWLSTGAYGVSCFDGEKFASFRTDENLSLNNSSKSNWSLSKDDIWFFAGGGTFRFQEGEFNYLPLVPKNSSGNIDSNPPYKVGPYAVYSILKDRSGKLWFGTQSMGVCCYDGKSFTWFTELGLKGPAVLSIFEDNSGQLWFGNNGGGLFCYDGKSLRNLSSEFGLTNPDFVKSGKQGPGTLSRVWSISEDNSGQLWIGTGDAGIWTYDGRNLENISPPNVFQNFGIETIYKDKNGELWFGTNGGGVYKQTGRNFSRQFLH